jgi:tetratricopeptide (TPR) repeat protein
LAGEPLPEKEITRLGMQLAEALEEAHERGVVHRDLKPGNVMVTPKGQAKILDFGLAKLLRPVSETATTESFTETQGVAGTLPYMAPEQLRGSAPDHRSDIYSFGVVLYEMATGQRPFQERLATALVHDIITKPPPPPGRLKPDLSSRLEETILKALEKEPENRYQSAKEIAVDLRRLKRDTDSGRAVAALPVALGRTKRWKLWLAATALVAVLVAALAFFLILERRPRGIGAVGRPAVAVMPFENLSGSEETQWLSQGIPNLLLTGLGQIPGLDVVGSQRLREILNQMGGGELKAINKGRALEVARRAGAGAIVGGSIFPAGPEVRIDVQVEDVGSGRLLFAHSVRGKDIFLLVDELTEQIRTSLNLAAGPSARSVAELTTDSPEAYQLYTEAMEARKHVRGWQVRELLQRAVEIDPSFAMAYFRLSFASGVDRASREEYRRRALEHLDRLPERQKLYLQADVYQQQGNLDDAIKTFEQLLARYPDEEQAYSSLSRLYRLFIHDPEKQLAVLQRGVKALPGSGFLHNHYGGAMLSYGLYAEALREFEIYAQLNPREANPHDSLGWAYLVIGQPEEALERYTRALEVDPSFFLAHGGRVWGYAILGRYDEALNELAEEEKIRKRVGSNPTRALFMKAFMLSRVGRYREAEPHILQGIQLADKDDWRGRLPFELLSALLALEKHNYSLARAGASRAQKLFPKDPSPQNAPSQDDAVMLTHVLAGTAEAWSGRLEAAQAHLESARKLYDRSFPWFRMWWYHALEGEIALAEGNLAAAEAAFSGGEPEIKMYFFVGPTAIVFANHFPSRDWPARVKKARGDLNGAIDAYRKLLTPDISRKWTTMLEPRYVLELARLLAQTGDTQAAKKEYERFLELWKDADPDIPTLQEAKAEYAKLK